MVFTIFLILLGSFAPQNVSGNTLLMEIPVFLNLHADVFFFQRISNLTFVYKDHQQKTSKIHAIISNFEQRRRFLEDYRNRQCLVEDAVEDAWKTRGRRSESTIGPWKTLEILDLKESCRFG